MSDNANLTIEAAVVDGVEIEGMVRVRTDRPGERATSAVVDGRELIAMIQTALGDTPETSDPETDPPEEEAPAL